MKIKLTSVYVDDQDRALRFYTEVLGFAKKTDFSNGPYRWLTVASPEEPDGTELQLALNNNPAAKAYQQAMFQQGQPGAMFFTDDVKGDYERINQFDYPARLHASITTTISGNQDVKKYRMKRRILPHRARRIEGDNFALQFGRDTMIFVPKPNSR